MTFTPFLLILAALVTYRLTVLLTEDVIMGPVREFWQRRFPTSDFYYNEKHVRPVPTIPDADGRMREPWEGTVRAWPFTRKVVLSAGTDPKEWVPSKTYTAGTLVECFYCASIWVALAVTAFTYAASGFSYDIQFLLNFAGIAAGAEIINNVASR